MPACESSDSFRSIKDIVPHITEVIPYTWDDTAYQYRHFFQSFITNYLNDYPSFSAPKLIHMLGIPGCGKSSFYQTHQADFKDYIHIDFDDVMEKALCYQQDILKLGKENAFQKWELPARIAGYELLRIAIATRKNIFLDHGCSPNCHKELLLNAKKAGYETTMYYIECDVQTALNRVAQRGRPFPKDRLLERHKLIQQRVKEMPTVVDHFIIINNDISLFLR